MRARKIKLNHGFYRVPSSPHTKNKEKKNPQAHIFIHRDSSGLISCYIPLEGRTVVALIVSLLRNQLPSAFKLELVTLGLTVHYFEALQH